MGSKHRGICWGIFVGLALPANFHCWIIIVRIARIAAAGYCASHVIFWIFAQTSFLGVKSIKSISRTLVDTVDTFRRPPLTPHVLSAFTVISDETRKYFAISVSTGCYRVGHSPLLLYYELLISLMKLQIGNDDICTCMKIFNTHQTTGKYHMRFWHSSHHSFSMRTYTKSNKALYRETG